MAKYEFWVSEDMAGQRLDQCLGRSIESLSRSNARVALDLGAVFVDRKRVKIASRRVSAGQHVVVHLGGAFERAEKQVGRRARMASEAQLPRYRVLFEDSDIVVVDKPAGLLSAPTPEGDWGNLQTQLARRTQPAQRIDVVQRLDLHTSGVLVYAKSRIAGERLSEMFRRHALVRRYDVFAAGSPSSETFTVRQSLAGKPALTHFRIVERHERFCHLEATLETGRTHQIRRHLLSRGMPVLADVTYGTREPWHPPRLALHAKYLEFSHPVTSEVLAFAQELPEDLRVWLAAARAPRETDSISMSGSHA